MQVKIGLVGGGVCSRSFALTKFGTNLSKKACGAIRGPLIGPCCTYWCHKHACAQTHKTGDINFFSNYDDSALLLFTCMVFFGGVLHSQIIDDELIPHSKQGSSDLLHIHAIINQMNIQWHVFHIAHVRNVSFAEDGKQHLVKQGTLWLSRFILCVKCSQSCPKGCH